jgi:ABC-type transport system involved in multi-copper enzyme maturation permease subunit
MIVGPVFWMEMKAGGRRARHYATRAFFVSVIFAIVVAAWFAFVSQRYVRFGVVVSSLTPLAPHEIAELGHQIFSAYTIAQFLLVVFFAPLYTAGAVAADRERRVLEMLFMTDLGNVELVASKVLVRVIHLCSLAVSGLPVMFLCLLLGGVAVEELLMASALTISIVLFVSSLGLLVSIGSRRAYGAIIVLYLILLVVWLALPLVSALLYFSGSSTNSQLTNNVCLSIIGLNPLIALLSVVAVGGIPTGLVGDPARMCVVVYLILSIVLMAINILIIRKLGLWASRERVVRDRPARRERRTRQVWSNPVAWREVKTIAIHRRMRWARILCLLFSLMVSSIVWIGWLADFLRGRRALMMDHEGLSGIVACTASVAWILMALQGAVSFSHEREHVTLDALLTAPISAVQIILGKLQGIFRSSAFALAFPIVITLLGWTRDVTSTRAALLSIAIVFVVGLFAACLGLACSVRLGSSGKACGFAAGLMLMLCVGVPFAAANFISYNNRHQWTRFTFVSPSLSLSWAIVDEVDAHGHRLRARSWPQYQDWPERLGIAVGHTSLQVLAAAVLLGWSIAHIESQCRVRQSTFARRVLTHQVFGQHKSEQATSHRIQPLPQPPGGIRG